MLNYAALALVFATMTVGIPQHGGRAWSAARSASHSRTPSRPPTSPRPSSVPSPAGSRKIHDGVASLAKGKEQHGAAAANRPPCKTYLRSTSAKRAPTQAASAATKVLNPFDGQPPGYNYRGPNGASPSPAARQLATPTEQRPRKRRRRARIPARQTGQYTRDMAVDVTELQNGNGKDVS